MRRDSIFYQLFQQSPSRLFQLLENPPVVGWVERSETQQMIVMCCAVANTAYKIGDRTTPDIKLDKALKKWKQYLNFSGAVNVRDRSSNN